MPRTLFMKLFLAHSKAPRSGAQLWDTQAGGWGGGFERQIRVPVSPAPQPGEALNLPAAVTPAPGTQEPCDIGEAKGGLGVRTGDQRSRRNVGSLGL